MNPTEWIDPRIANWIVIALGHVLWQGFVLAGLAMLVTLALRQHAAKTRYLVHCSALLLIAVCWPVNFWLTAPATDTPIPLPVVAEAAETLETESDVPDPLAVMIDQSFTAESLTSESASTLEADRDAVVSASQTAPSALNASDWWPTLSPWLVALYVLGAMVMALRLVAGLYGSQRLRASAEPVQGSHLQADMVRLARRVGLSVAPVVAMSARVTTPLVVGVLKPAILLPAAMLSGLRPDQVEALLLHELAHIRRYDHVVNFLQRIVETLLFFHPAVWWLSSRISLEREHCCDDLAVAWGGNACDYAESLVRVSELRFQAAGLGPASATVLAATGGQPSRLQRRVLRVLGMPLAGPTIGLTRLGMATLLVVSLSTAVIIANQDQPDDAAPVSESVQLDVAITPEIAANETDAPEIAANETDVPQLAAPEDPASIVRGPASAVAPAPTTAPAPATATASADAPASAPTTGVQTSVMTMAVAAPSSDVQDLEAAPSSRIRQRHFVRVVVGKTQIGVDGKIYSLDQLDNVYAKLAQLPKLRHTVLEYATTPDCKQQLQDEFFQLALREGFEYFSLTGTHPLHATGSPAEYVVFDPKREAALQAVIRDLKRRSHRDRVQLVLLPDGHLRIEGHLIEREQLLRILRAFNSQTKQRLQIIRIIDQPDQLPTLSRYLGQAGDEQVDIELWKVIAEVLDFAEMRWVTVSSDDKYWDLRLAIIGVWSGPGPEKLSLIFNPDHEYMDMFGEVGAWRLDKTTLVREITKSSDSTQIGRQINQQVIQLDDDELVLQDGDQELRLYRAIDFYNLTLQRFHSTTDPADLPDLWQVTKDSQPSQYVLREGVKIVYQAQDGTVYFLPDKSTYYIQAAIGRDPQQRIYGPYRGDPLKSLDLPKQGVEAAKQIALIEVMNEAMRQQQLAIAVSGVAARPDVLVAAVINVTPDLFVGDLAADAKRPQGLVVAHQRLSRIGSTVLKDAGVEYAVHSVPHTSLLEVSVRAANEKLARESLQLVLDRFFAEVAESSADQFELVQAPQRVSLTQGQAAAQGRAAAQQQVAAGRLVAADQQDDRMLAEQHLAQMRQRLRHAAASDQADLQANRAATKKWEAELDLARLDRDVEKQKDAILHLIVLVKRELDLTQEQTEQGGLPASAHDVLQERFAELKRKYDQLLSAQDVGYTGSDATPPDEVAVSESKAAQQARQAVERQRKALAQLQVATAKQHLERVKKFHANGQASQGELAKAQEGYYVAQENLAKVENDKRGQLEMLNKQLEIRNQDLDLLNKQIAAGVTQRHVLDQAHLAIAKLRLRIAEIEQQIITEREATSSSF